jgi:ubiquinol oxidase
MKHRQAFTGDTLNIHHAKTGINDCIALGVVKTMGLFSSAL